MYKNELFVEIKMTELRNSTIEHVILIFEPNVYNITLRLILKENSFHFNGKNLQTHGTAMGIKMAVSFANISVHGRGRNRNHKPEPLQAAHLERYIDDVFSLWNINKGEINSFIELANSYHATTKFTAEISDKEITFLDTCV